MTDSNLERTGDREEEGLKMVLIRERESGHP